MTSPVSYVASGNISGITVPGSPTIASTYNQANRLASVATPAQSAEYTYDGFGQRLEKRLPSSPSIIYQYGQGGTLLLEENDNGSITDYIYVNGKPMALFQPTGGAGTLDFIHDDHLGTPQFVTNSSQAVVWSTTYQPYGKTALPVGSVTQNLRLPGQYFDSETGFYQNGARDYVPSLGRYLETDPIGLGGGLNTYLYANGNPLKFIDPSGLDAFNTGGLDFGMSPTAQAIATAPITPGLLYLQNTPGAMNAALNPPEQPDMLATAGSAWFNVLTWLALGPERLGEAAAVETVQMCRVGRWMSEAELKAMQASGRVQQSLNEGVTSVTVPPNPGAYLAAKSGDVFVEFDVPDAAVLIRDSSIGKIYGPDSLIGGKTNVTEMPPATNIVPKNQ